MRNPRKEQISIPTRHRTRRNRKKDDKTTGNAEQPGDNECQATEDEEVFYDDDNDVQSEDDILDRLDHVQ